VHQQFQLLLIGRVLMPDHFHLLLKPQLASP
jgi:REP element-mobilizing transposase RayT